MFPSRYMPCPDCGASVERSETTAHECDDERRLDYDVFHLRDDVAAFDDDLAAFLSSPRGRFEAWYAARERGRADDA